MTRDSVENISRVAGGKKKDIRRHIGRNVSSEVDSSDVSYGVEEVFSGPDERECHGEGHQYD